MKTVNANLSSAIRSNYALAAQPRLTAEWNMNRYFNPTADNIPSEDSDGFDVEFFPIESIYANNRPTKGVTKARIGESTTSGGYSTNDNRYYIGSVDDTYKYWSSPVQTDAFGNFGGAPDGWRMVRPHVMYSSTVQTNKIVVKVDNYWASPLQFFIKTTTANTPTNMGSWTTVATNPTIAADGTITLWWSGSAWTQTKPANLIDPPLRALRGVMLQVDSMGPGRDRNGNISRYRYVTNSGLPSQVYNTRPTTGANSFFNLIEISARREVDLTNRLLSVSDDFELSAVSELYPIGTITSNTGSITLSNIFTDTDGINKSGFFNKSNATSPYFGLLEPNVAFNLEYVYTIGSNVFPVQQFKMYGGEWNGLVSDEVSIELADFSKFLNETYPRPALWSNYSIPELVQRILDSVGFVDWVIDSTVTATDHIIPNFWVDGEMNVWEVLDDLAKGTQSAIYFDGFGKLRIRTRDNAYNPNKALDWTLRSVKSGTDLPDIVDVVQGQDLGANHLTITYKSTDWAPEVNGVPALETVWQPPESSVVLRASTLTYPINDASTAVRIPPSDAVLWPFKGMFEIEGEIFRYYSKQFVYYTYNETINGAGGISYSGEKVNYGYPTSLDEYKAMNDKTPYLYKFKNHFTGNLMLDTEDGRGVWASQKSDHVVDINGWTCDREWRNGPFATALANTSGMNHDKGNSSMVLRSAGGSRGDDITVAKRGTVGADGYKAYGTNIKFLVDNGGHADQAGGFIMYHGPTHDGYWVELKASSKIANKDRARRAEISLFRRINGSFKLLDSNDVPVLEGYDYDVDAQIIQEGGNHRVVIWVNGTQYMSRLVTGADKPDVTGRFATYVRGDSDAAFQYFYAIRRDPVALDDDATFFNLKNGGYTGKFWDREIVWKWKTVTRRTKKGTTKTRQKWAISFFDEFGPIVHEVAEYNVNFDPKPVLHSRLYSTNDMDAICTEYQSSPFGAKFIMANVSRQNAVINGEDSLLFGSSNPVSQVLQVIGRVLIEEEGETIVVKDENSIRIRGKVESEISSSWIQSKAMAEDISAWMAKHWSKGVDQLEVEIFGNPLIEIGDVVGMEYPEKYMTAATHKYFVISAKTNFDQGVRTTLGLRRVI